MNTFKLLKNYQDGHSERFQRISNLVTNLQTYIEQLWKDRKYERINNDCLKSLLKM